jgi:hypothetical protein
VATPSSKDPFEELLAEKRRLDAKTAKSAADPFEELLKEKRRLDAEKASSVPVAAPEPEKPKKSFLDNAAETMSDMGVGAADEATYGYLPKAISYLMPVADEKKAEQDIKDRVALADKRSPVASTIGKVGGFALSPVTKLLGGALGAESKLASLLKDTGAVAKSPALRALAKTLGFALPVAEGSSMVAAHEGEHTPVEIAGGGVFNAAFNKLPRLVKGAVVGSQLADQAGDEYLPNAGKVPAIAGALAGALTGKGGSMMLNAMNAKRDPVELKKPLEFLENQYEKIGADIPKEMRGKNRTYEIPDWEQQSDKVRALKDRIGVLRAKSLSDAPEAIKTAYDQSTKFLGDINHDTLRDVFENPDKMTKLLTALQAMNEAANKNEKPQETLQKIISQKQLITDKVNYDPLDDNVGDIILGKIRQTPIRHLRAFNNAFSETKDMKDFYPEAIPNHVLDTYRRNLEIEKDVDAGKLNKWLRDPEIAGHDTPEYARLFNPKKPHELLTDAAAKKMADEGKIVTFSPKKATPKTIEKNITNTTSTSDMSDFGDFVKKKNGELPDDQSAQDMLDILMSSSKNNSSSAKDIMSSNKPTPDQTELTGLMQRLYDMREGRRQLSIDRNEPSKIPYIIKDTINRLSPLNMGEVGKISELLPFNKLAEMDKSLRAQGRRYGKGKSIENMPDELKPQIYRLSELSKRDDAIGTFAKHMLEQVQAGNVDDFIKGMVMANKNNELKKFLQ